MQTAVRMVFERQRAGGQSRPTQPTLAVGQKHTEETPLGIKMGVR